MNCHENERHRVKTRLRSCFGVIVLLAAFLLEGQAFAQQPTETITLVPADRIMDVQAPKGLLTTLDKQNGLLTITVDDDGSDWDQAIVYDGDLRFLELMAGVVPPDGATGFRLENGLPFDTDDEAIATFKSSEQNSYFQPTSLQVMDSTAPQMVAEYVPEKKILSTISSDNMYIYVRWYDAQNKAILTEKMRIVVKHAQPQSRYASPNMTRQSDIIANTDSLSHLSSVIKDGEVIYTFTDPQAISNPKDYILTKITAPTGAVGCNQVDIRMGSTPLPITNGCVELKSVYKEQQVSFLKTGVWRENYVLEWLDANGNVLDASMVVLYINMFEREPWPCYVTDTSGVQWNAVPSDRLHVVKGAALADVDISYQSSNGILQYGYQNVLSRANGMETATVRISVTPPAGAVKYTTTGEGGSGKLGRRGGNSYYSRLLSKDKRMILSDTVSMWDYPIFEKIDAPDGKVSIYLSTLPDDPDECSVNVICWFDSNDNPISIEYYATLSNHFYMEVKTDVYDSEASVPERQAYPVVVEENGTLRGCKLVITQYPQSEENGLYYELRLEDAFGKVIEPHRKVILYLPYPPGHSYGQQGWVYQLQHYNLDFQKFTAISLTQTPKGLRCETDSFSPFVLSWGAAPSPMPVSTTEPPKTGDSSEPLLWLGALALAIIGMGCLAIGGKKRKKV